MKYQGFYDYALGDDGKPDRTFTAQQFCKHLSAIFGNGIVITNATGNDAWRVEKITDLKIKIKLGNNNFNFASLRGNPFAVDEEINIELSQGTDRWDAIMIRADATSTVRATDIKVTENSIALTRTDTIYDLRLARVHVVNSVITEIIDDRLNNDYCGIAAGLATINADDILNSIKSELESIESGAAVALKNGILQKNLNSEMLGGKKINEIMTPLSLKIENPKMTTLEHSMTNKLNWIVYNLLQTNWNVSEDGKKLTKDGMSIETDNLINLKNINSGNVVQCPKGATAEIVVDVGELRKITNKIGIRT